MTDEIDDALLDQDRCPNCGQRVFGIRHSCNGEAPPISLRDAVETVEAVAEKQRAGLRMACGEQENDAHSV